ncbi:related to chromosome-associated kinesin KIF4 [Rhynchosporium agropyri]|uniref:Kinesin-like protein n=1 Tax=Rhynchosporium agropyri TaxID=914238 RepID=A0A1E1LSW1_9HELO|nr:related to chromosome-associated kinesin KIF4 [Rhynchosporium agropyri]
MAKTRASPADSAHKHIMSRPLQSSSARAQSIATSRVDRSGAVSPANSTSTATIHAGSKRKERDFERDAGEESNINVVVRCRGRNDREIRENSGVVLSTDGVKGTTVKLSMGPTALSNKTYHFDKVFAPAADQSMIYDDVVTPILDEMFAGFNCTIFAYGQTGTGKTYTMSGDMDTTAGMLSEAAGIIPRALHALFNKLELNDVENFVKCSFIELYNEELRDLISADENTKLKIYDDTSKKGHASTLVQGMEESHIKSAAEGVKLLQAGSHRRQVAATKCNDLSSRSHTVFTVTAYIKRTSDNGEEYVSAGKLNLVDLAGSENIQRSGAENKRAAEAGLINKSLLTLGRVINALVDRGPHVPYRESKLTRLLQDSLGGRTKTCIIATVSPAKSNLEETISTLDYAFRAKNIRNKPQINQMVNKKTLLKDFTCEIEKLKSELIATRQRNGVYLSQENFEELTVENESRRVLAEEQAVKIEAMEINLRNKVQELFSLTTNFMSMKKENEATKTLLDKTKNVLEQTEIVLATTQRNLGQETILREAHQETEQKLNVVGGALSLLLEELSTTLVNFARKSEENRISNRSTEISEDYRKLNQQEKLLSEVSTRVQNFVRDDLEKLAATQTIIQEKVAEFDMSGEEASQHASRAKNEMDIVLEEIKTIMKEVKWKISQELEGLSAAAERISAEILNVLDALHTQLHGSYSLIERNSKDMFEELHQHITAQRIEVNGLKEQLRAATDAAVLTNDKASTRIEEILSEERQQASTDRQNLLAQITSLVVANGHAQENRLTSKIDDVRGGITASKESLEAAQSAYSKGMESWNYKESRFVKDVWTSRESMTSRLKEDWNVSLSPRKCT